MSNEEIITINQKIDFVDESLDLAKEKLVTLIFTNGWGCPPANVAPAVGDRIAAAREKFAAPVAISHHICCALVRGVTELFGGYHVDIPPLAAEIVVLLQTKRNFERSLERIMAIHCEGLINECVDDIDRQLQEIGGGGE